jgi:hypothetical protein
MWPLVLSVRVGRNWALATFLLKQLNRGLQRLVFSPRQFPQLHGKYPSRLQATGCAPRCFRASSAVNPFLAALAWALYMAVEPYMRRHWPQVLIGWTRALEGHFRDPLVAGHILAGIAAGIGVAVLTSAADTVTGTYQSPNLSSLDTLGVIAFWFHFLASQPTFALALFFLFLLLRLLLRRTWLAASVVVVAFAGLAVASGSLASLAQAPLVVAMLLLNLAVSIRFGMLALTASLVLIPSFGLPLTSHFSAWALLSDRFNLRVHRETRDLKRYVLIPAGAGSHESCESDRARSHDGHNTEIVPVLIQ